MEEHFIFFMYTFLNTISRIVARQISVRLERRMHAADAVASISGKEEIHEEIETEDSEEAGEPEEA